MHFANISSFGPHHHDYGGSQWSLHRPNSKTFGSLLGFDNHDLEVEETLQDDARFERLVDLVPGREDNGELCHDCNGGQCKRIHINVSGIIFETQLGTLNRYPNTLLGNPTKRRLYWDMNKRCYFLDQHAPTFQCILYYYQSGGRLYRPEDVPEEVFLNELDFYELGQDVLKDFKKQNGFLPEPDIILPKKRWQKQLWLILEYPTSSMPARVVGVLSLLIIAMSILNFCLESMPMFEENLCINTTDVISAADGKTRSRERQNYGSPFFIVEVICAFWFTVEVVLRFISCPSKKRFFASFLNLFDIGAVVPFYVITSMVLFTGTCDHTKRSSISIVFIRVLRLFRAFRIFKLTKHSRGMQILGMTIQKSLKELSLFGIFLGIAMIFFSSAVYYADMYDTNSQNIESIPDGFWWTIITMCTVGYGDVVPKGLLGKLVGSLCVISGVITIALLVPVVVSNFSNYYSHETSFGAKKQKKKNSPAVEGEPAEQPLISVTRASSGN